MADIVTVVVAILVLGVLMWVISRPSLKKPPTWVFVLIVVIAFAALFCGADSIFDLSWASLHSESSGVWPSHS